MGRSRRAWLDRPANAKLVDNADLWETGCAHTAKGRRAHNNEIDEGTPTPPTHWEATIHNAGWSGETDTTLPTALVPQSSLKRVLPTAGPMCMC
eukprot:gene10043-biopygen13814